MSLISRQKAITEAFSYLKSIGLVSTQKDLAAKMNSTAPNVSKALAGDPKALTENFMKRLNLSFGEIFNERWLLNLEGSMLADKTDKQIVAFEYNEKENMFHENVGCKEEFTNGYQTICKTTYSVWDPFRAKIREIQNRGHKFTYKELLIAWETYFNEYSEKDTQEDTSDMTDDFLVPLIPTDARAGILAGISEGVDLRDCRKIPAPVPGADYAIQISGNSMEPEYRNGSFLFIKKINSNIFIPWGHDVVLDTENGAVFKKIFKGEDYPQTIIARSINPNYPDLDIDTIGIYGIYKVVGSSFINSTI